MTLRIKKDTLDLLERESRRTRQTRSELARTLIEEGLRMQRHPGIIFKDGPVGRRPAVFGGPDVWEIIRAYKQMGGGEKAVKRLAKDIVLAPHLIHAALDYCAAYQAEIDDWIEMVEVESERAHKEWLKRQELLQREVAAR